MSIKDLISMPTGPSDPEPAPPRSKAWMLPIGVGIGALVIGIGIGAAPGATPATPPNGSGFFTATVNVPGPTVTAGGTATVTVPGPTVTGTAPPAVTQTVPGPTVTLPPTTIQVPGPTVTAPPAPPAVAFADGKYEVGVDVAPGKYKTTTTAEANGGLCYIDVENTKIVAQEVTDKGYTILVIRPEWKGSIVDSRDCGPWAKVG